MRWRWEHNRQYMNDTLTAVYTLSCPRERPWRQHVVQNKTLIIVRITIFPKKKSDYGIDAQRMRFAEFTLQRADE